MMTRTLALGAKLLRFTLVVLPLATALSGGFTAMAGEALSDLDLQIRLVGVEPGRGQGRDMKGAARIEAVLRVSQATESIRLTVERPDGSSWTVGSQPFDPEPLKWRTLDGGEPQEAESGRPMAGPHQALRTTLVVPLKGADVHEIVVRVSGVGPGGSLTTEAMLKAPLGVELELPVEKDGVATFKMKEGRQ
jgi:hypothetical protein